MNLIDKYIEQVGENLPAKDREDIKKEIRSILEDTLENRSQQENRPVDEVMMISVLKEFGTPRKMAEAYMPPRYLIGPRLFPTFLMVTKIVLGIVLLVGIVTTSVTLFQQPLTLESAFELVLKRLLELLGSMLSVLGNIVFVFAIIEWAFSKEKSINEENWDPKSLEGEEYRDEIKPWSQVPDIALTIFTLLFFNLFTTKLGAYFNDASGISVFIPARSPVFFTYLPWFNTIWVLGLGLNFALIRIGKWQPWSRWFQVGLDVMSLIVLILMASGPSIIAPATDNFSTYGFTGSQIAGIYSGLAIGIKALLIILIIVFIYDIGETVYRIFRKK